MVVSEVCAISKVLYSVSDGHYTESGNCSVSDEEKGRCTPGTHVTYLGKVGCVLGMRVSHWK
jgi:hypothetical protein